MFSLALCVVLAAGNNPPPISDQPLGSAPPPYFTGVGAAAGPSGPQTATFISPTWIAGNGAGAFWVLDIGNDEVRMIGSGVSTFGTVPAAWQVGGMVYDPTTGSLYFTQSTLHLIYKMSPNG